jgi:ankyrin repeat protein/Tol biopolymer transport system component
MKTRIFVFFMLIALIPTAFAAEVHDAARAGDLAKVKALIEKDPGLILAVDSEGKTPLHGAAEIGRKDVAAYLIEKGAVIDQRDSMNRTPLWWCAARSQSVEIARLLLDKGADINATDGGWGPPLMMAAVGGSAPMVDLFLERGVAIPGPSDPFMAGLVTFSVKNGLVKLVNRLVSTGLNVLAKDDAGDSLMHKAATGGSPEIIDIFIKAGLSVSEADRIGWTPLHFAAEAGRLQAVEILLAKGAPLDARTTEGKTALNLALEWKKKDVADFLTTKGADRSEPKFPVLTGPYLGQKLPGKTPELFARGIAAAKYAFHGGVAFSPDGQSAYWSVQEYGGSMASLESSNVGGRWTMPKPMSFVVLGQTDDVPFPSPDGRKLFFVSGRPLEKGGQGGKENIWVMDRTASGWSEPRPLPAVVNAMNMHWQVSVDLRGHLYFGAREEGGQGFGLQDIYWSKFENGTYAKPENLGAAINGPGFEHSPFIAPDGSYLIFSKSNPQARVDSLFISFRKPEGTWSRSRDLNGVMGYRNRSMCPWVTPDGKYLFFAGIVAGENMPFWVEAGFIEDLRKAALLPSASEIIGATIEKEGPASAEAKFKELRAQPDRYSFVERDFNLLGYRFLQSDALPEAIAVFQMNIELFPESANNYDSLGEAYMTAGDKAASKANYQRAVDKDPNSANAKDVLASFDAIFERTQNERKIAYQPGQQTGLKGPYFGQIPPGKTPQIFAPGVVSLLTTSDYAVTFSPDGKEFYFTRGGNPQVIMVCREEAGGWTAPAPAAFSAGFSAHEPHLTLDNKRIYWGWFRPIPPGEPNLQHMDYGIWASDRAPDGWSAPKFVGQGMFVSSSMDGQIYVTDHTELPNGYLAKVNMADGRFAGFVRLRGGLDKLRSQSTNIAHPAIAPDGSYIVFDVGGGPHLYVCFRNPDGTWSEAVDLSRHSLDPRGGIAKISPDGKFLFFGMSGDIYWVSTSLIEDLRPRGK